MCRKKVGHRSHGSNTVEFTYCLVFIFFVILLPLSNYGTFLTRWTISSQVVTAWTQSLAKKRKLSDAFKRVKDDDFAADIKKTGGITLKDVSPTLVVSRVDNPTERIIVAVPGRIPPGWQPNKGNFQYTLHITVLAEIEPLVTVQLLGLKVPGLTEPTEVVLSSNALWENMGRDPVTTELYVNE